MLKPFAITTKLIEKKQLYSASSANKKQHEKVLSQNQASPIKEFKLIDEFIMAQDDEDLDLIDQNSQAINNKEGSEYLAVKRASKSLKLQRCEEELLNFMPSFNKMDGGKKMRIIEDLFKGKNNAIQQGIHIFQTNKTLKEELCKNKIYKEAIESALPTFNYEDIVKVLKDKYKELKYDQNLEFNTIKDLIPMMRDVKPLKDDNGQSPVIFSKLTPLMIKQRIEANHKTMSMEEFFGLQKLLNLDSKLRHLQMANPNYDFYRKKQKMRDIQEHEFLMRLQDHRKKVQLIKKHKDIDQMFNTAQQNEKNQTRQKLSFINTARLNQNYGNNMSDYIQLFAFKNQDKWKKIKEKQRQEELRKRLLREKSIAPSPNTIARRRRLFSEVQTIEFDQSDSDHETQTKTSRPIINPLKVAQEASFTQSTPLDPQNFTKSVQTLFSKRLAKNYSQPTLKPAQLQGSITEFFPKYNKLLNKPKLPFYEVIKFPKELKREQVETHQAVMAVNKAYVKKGIKIRENVEQDDPNIFYRNFLKSQQQKGSSQSLGGIDKNNNSHQARDNKELGIHSNCDNQNTAQSDFFSSLTRSRFVGTKYNIIPKKFESRPPTACFKEYLQISGNRKQPPQTAREKTNSARLTNALNLDIKQSYARVNDASGVRQQSDFNNQNANKSQECPLQIQKRITIMDLGKRSFQKELVKGVIQQVLSKRKPNL